MGCHFASDDGKRTRKQIDGLGGSQSVTSQGGNRWKAFTRVDADVDYTFAQVSVDKPIVSY